MSFSGGAGEEPLAGLIFTPVLSEFRQQALGKDGVTIFPSFSLFNPNHHSGRIAFNVFGSQIASLSRNPEL